LSPRATYGLSFRTYDISWDLTFYDGIYLTFSKEYSTFIYTDKGMYKPEDTMNFAIFCVNLETRPHNPSGGSVTIYDSQNTEIKTIANVSFVGGKYEGSFVLSGLAREGEWRLSFWEDKKVTL
jgi:uncharacterized protein YfaS (alpha-2-macroglobulin family)